jgi:hypothetical protein
MALRLSGPLAPRAARASRPGTRRRVEPADRPGRAAAARRRARQSAGRLPGRGRRPAAELRVRRAQDARLDALIDAIARWRSNRPSAASWRWCTCRPARRAGTKPFLIEGLNAETGEWEPPVAGQRYGEFQAGVQMANRSGALNEIEYSEFVQKVQAFADGVGAMPTCPTCWTWWPARASSTPSPAATMRS